MSDKIVNIPFSIEHKRDAYGFALRPQHLQRYREYATIYKEEEQERAQKWKGFLEQQAKSNQYRSSEVLNEENLQVDIVKQNIRIATDETKEGDNQTGSTALDGSAQSSIESEVQATSNSKSKTDKVKKWANIQPVVGAIDEMMSFRVQKSKNMVNDLETTNGIHLPTVDEAGNLEKNSSNDGEGVVDLEEASDESNESFSEEVAESKGVPAEPLSPWREELECLVRGGVPKDLRGDVWQAFVGVRTRRKERYYQNLLAEDINDIGGGVADETSGVPRKWKKQIEKDIPRTFPGHPALDENGRNALRRLLLAYARHNPSVGYCQAMNFFAGLLLLLMPEENAFWTLVGIIDDYFDGYYTEDMIESQVDQLVFEDLMRERFPKLVNHLDFLGVQVAWISGPWFLSIFINMLPWESVLRVWDVLLFEGNRVMLFRTALALMELYGPAIVTTKDAGDAITLLQSLAGSTFDSSQLVLTACMGFLPVTEARLQELRKKHRPVVLEVVEERSKKGRVWKDSKGLASKLYSFKHESRPSVKDTQTSKGSGDVPAESDGPNLEHSSDLETFLGCLDGDTEVDSLPDLQEQVVWLKVELCRLLEEKRSAILRAEELETALMEMVEQDNRLQLSAKVEQLEEEITELRQALADKKEQEKAMLQVLMRVEQEQRVTEEARMSAEQDAATQRCALQVLQSKKTLQERYEKAQASLAQMEKRVVMAESMLEATLHYESGQNKALSSPRSAHNLSSPKDTPVRRISLFGFGWRDRSKDKPPNLEESRSGKSTHEGGETSLHKEGNDQQQKEGS